MPPLHTIEVRWYPETQPFPVSNYFSEAHQAPERVDWYAVPCDDGSGVKLREGRLETKFRAAQLGALDFGNEVLGHVETWSKWSVVLETGEQPSEAILTAANWMAVAKLRYVRRFEIRGDQIVETMDRTENGCSFELTKLVINGSTYWTTGFEAAFSPECSETAQRVLRNVVDFIGNIRTLPTLSANISLGYPAWLNRFAQ